MGLIPRVGGVIGPLSSSVFKFTVSEIARLRNVVPFRGCSKDADGVNVERVLVFWFMECLRTRDIARTLPSFSGSSHEPLAVYYRRELSPSAALCWCVFLGIVSMYSWAFGGLAHGHPQVAWSVLTGRKDRIARQTGANQQEARRRIGHPTGMESSRAIRETACAPNSH